MRIGQEVNVQASGGEVLKRCDLVWTFDLLPDMRLSQNALSKAGPYERSWLTRDAKALWEKLLAAATGWPRIKVTCPTPASLTYRFTLPNRHRQDLDNMLSAMRPCTNALVSLGIIPDDSTKYLAQVHVEARYEKGVSRTVIELKEVQQP